MNDSLVFRLDYIAEKKVFRLTYPDHMGGNFTNDFGDPITAIRFIARGLEAVASAIDGGSQN